MTSLILATIDTQFTVADCVIVFVLALIAILIGRRI